MTDGAADLLARARAEGAVEHFRVVVAQGLEVWTRDFEARDAAIGYVDDVVAEVGAGPAAGLVVDRRFEVVHTARPFFRS